MKQDYETAREKIIILEKGKKGILRILFGRTTIVFFLLLIQIFLLVLCFGYLNRYSVYIFGAYTVLGYIVVIYILNRRGEPAFQLTWIVIVMILPIFGVLLYLFVKTQIGTRLLNRRIKELEKRTRDYSRQDERVYQQLKEENRGVANLGSYILKRAGFPVYNNTTVEYFPIGEEMLEEMLKELEKAKNFIFLEYFIVEEGYMWGRILEVLLRKVREGVEVRFMYDGLCSLALLPYNYPKKIEKLGIRCKMFSPIKPALSTHQNNRDHRKILVIDGHTAFTGGINLADEYINKKSRFGHWKDTGIMLKGDGVRSFTLMFLQMWNINEREEDYRKYLDVELPIFKEATGYVMPYGDSPLDEEIVGELVYMDIINRAEEYVHIMTPYLILDYELITALTFAAKKGVEVIIIMPFIPDKRAAFALAKTYYKELIEAGVRIFQYIPGFVHAKVFTSDGDKAVVGTINLDFRSLHLHFECATYLYKVKEIKKIEEDMQDTLKKCKEVTLTDCKNERLQIKIIGSILRLFAPLM